MPPKKQLRLSTYFRPVAATSVTADVLEGSGQSESDDNVNTGAGTSKSTDNVGDNGAGGRADDLGDHDAGPGGSGGDHRGDNGGESDRDDEGDSSRDVGAVDDTVTKTKSATKRKIAPKFQQKWLSQYSWLTYNQQENKMYCQLCLKQPHIKNAMTNGTDNHKTSTLTRHLDSADHQKALLIPAAQNDLKKAISKVLTKEEQAITTAMRCVYWLAKEGLPLSKYRSLIGLLTELETPNMNALNVNEQANYTSYNTAADLLFSISQVIEDDITEKLKKSPHITILTDESTDIMVHHKLCISARIVHPTTLTPSTLFLSDVQIHDATGKGIFDEISSHLATRGISVKKVMGLGSDGASVMTGTKNGLTGHFLRQNPHLSNTHCVAHRLALVTEQAAKKVKALNEYQQTLESIYYHFKKSPKKVDQVAAIQELLQEPTLKYREIHEVRWLSFYNALDAIYRTMDSLITYLTTSSDAAATGLRKKVASELFISITYAMMDILQPVMKLCLIFQKKELDLGVVKVSVEECVKDLTDIRDDNNPLEKPTFLSKLWEDLKSGMFKGHHKVAKLTSVTHFTNVKRDFIDAILQNLAERFPENSMLSAFSVLALRPINHLQEDDLPEWGNHAIQSLCDHYGSQKSHKYMDEFKETITVTSEPIINKLDTSTEWTNLKKLVREQRYPASSMASLWQIIASCHKDHFPNLMVLASLALSHPVHTADCERTFSSQNMVTTPLRNRLSGDKCDQLMKIMIEGPNGSDFDFTKALLKWRTQKQRAIFKFPSHDK